MNTSEFEVDKMFETKKARAHFLECERQMLEDIPKLKAEIEEKLRQIQEVEAALERFRSDIDHE